MSFISRLFFKEQRSLTQPKMVDNARTYNPHFDSVSTNVNLNDAIYNSTVFACINLISSSISKFDLNIYKVDKNGKKIKYTDHKWFNSLHYLPNNKSRRRFIADALVSMYLTGNAFFYVDIVKKQFIELGELEKISPVLDNEVWYKFKGVDTWLPSRSLIHFSLVNRDGLGINPIEAIRTELEIQKGSEGALKNSLNNGLLSTLFLEADIEGAKLTDNNRAKEFLNKLENDFQGFQNSGKIPTIPPLYKLKSLPVNQIDFLANNKYTVSQITQIFSLPDIFTATQNASTYGKAEQQVALYAMCLSNVCSMIIDEFNKILTIDERSQGVTIEFDFKNLYDTDPSSKSTYLVALKNAGVVTPNEIREAFGMELIDNEYMNYTYMQAQYLPVQLMDKNTLLQNNTNPTPQPTNE